MAEQVKKSTRNTTETKRKILNAAKKEFMYHGFDGARVDEIAARAQVNKQLIYYYFESKDNLFVEILKQSYKKLRKAEKALDLDTMSGYEAILKFVEHDWNFYVKNPELIFFLASENLLNGRHIKEHKDEFWEINASWFGLMHHLLEKGKEDKSIRDDLDAVQLCISIAGLIIFSIMNESTLSYSLMTDLSTKEAKSKRLESIKQTIGCWIKPL